MKRLMRIPAFVYYRHVKIHNYEFKNLIYNLDIDNGFALNASPES